MPIKNSKIKDARPAITADAESEKGLFSGNVSKGTVNIKRGPGRVVSFALKYEEIGELRDLLGEIDELLTKNQYGTRDSLEDGYEAGSARTQQSSATAVQSKPAEAVVEGQVPSESGVVSSATQGTGAAPQAAENTIEPELASGAEAQAAFDAEPSRTEPVVSQPVTPADPDNPFAA